MTSSVPGITFGPRGFVVPTDEEILVGVMADINAAFGGNLNMALETPQGQLASSQAAIVSAADQTFAYMSQQMDPAYNAGRFQDAIARIYFLTRNPALPTTVSCLCVGAEGTIIPAGSLAQDVSGNIYSATDGGTIGVSGNITLDFANIIPGPIPCPQDTLTQIYIAIPGWDSINNPADGVIGESVETRAALEERRIESVAKNARGIIQAIQGAVLSVPGVLDAFSYQNDSGVSITYRGVTLAPHSIYVAVAGGDEDEIAFAIWSKKSPGCSYNGDTTVIVYDTSDYYTAPYPEYEVTFQRPDEKTIKFLVEIVDSASVPSDADTQVKNAVLAAFSGSDGSARARIGQTVYASNYVCPVRALGAWAVIRNLQVGTITPNADLVAVDIDEIPVTSAVDITVSLV